MFEFNEAELNQTITETQDIEQLRKISLILLHRDNEIFHGINELITLGIKSLASFSMLCAILFIFNSALILKQISIAEGRKIKWLRWL